MINRPISGELGGPVTSLWQVQKNNATNPEET